MISNLFIVVVAICSLLLFWFIQRVKIIRQFHLLI